MKAITRSQFQLAEQVRNRFTVSVESGAELDDFLKEEATQHIASHLRRGDILEICPEDQAWYAEVKVKEAGKTFAKFNVITFVRWAEKVEQPAEGGEQPPAEGDYTVTWGGPGQKFRVIRVADKEVMQSGFSDKEAAQAWIAEHQKTAA